MKAIILKQPGGIEQLMMVDLDIPIPNSDELLIRVESAAVNRTDIISREGKTGYLNNPILGVEVSGVVFKAHKSSSFRVGDRVMGLVNGGGYAEYVTMPCDRAIKIPESISFDQAAAIPEVFLTAYQTLYWLGKLKNKETVLIHAGASGVGTAAIQLAKQLSDAKVIVTAGSKRKLDFCRDLGADVMINYKTQNFSEEIDKATQGTGVDLILDFVGAEYWDQNLSSIKKEGRWVLIGILGGNIIDKVDLLPIMSKCIQLTGTLLTPRSNAYKALLTNEFNEKVLPYFVDGTIKPIIDSQYPLEDIGLAHQRMEDNKNIGKIIINMNQ